MHVAGSITCTALMYIFPGLFFYITSRRYKKGECLFAKTSAILVDTSLPFHLSVGMCYQVTGLITLVVGVLVMIACTVATVIGAL